MAILDFVREEHSYADLSKRRRLFLLILVSVGSSAIYTPIYLKSVFYDPLMQALGCTNEQLGTLVTVYAIAATVFYFFSGVVADKVRVRTLSWVGYAGTALLTSSTRCCRRTECCSRCSSAMRSSPSSFGGERASSLFASYIRRRNTPRESEFPMASSGRPGSF